MTDYSELIKELQKRAERWKNLRLDNSPDERLYTHAADAIEELDKQCDSIVADNVKLVEQLPRWISVSERLPEPGYCLAYMKSGLFSDRFYINIVEYDGHYFYEDRLATERVTHYMPLPQPPKEET